ncbi:immunoglobulin lambda-1 light chain-like [Archocentrus centrarchus]|uniref:immunoglobulin lambda-1 light chain-like n=1 Tax=Archocentrus centrarchus TaxID=63155 RepID=UPI0011EA0753|nr:immunoglobulin lambda-1 light chain-like [Archocentrus centrarchus]
MLFLPAAALCCLCSAMVTMAAELIQEELTLTRRAGERVSFSCGGTDQCSSNVVLWYQKTDTRDTFRMLLSISLNNGAVNRGYNHPEEDDFTAVKKQDSWELEVKTVKDVHSATYYCSCSKSSHNRIFGPGAKLLVTDKPTEKPVVSVYPAASSADPKGRRSLLCVASHMVPPLVKISWKRQKQDGPPEELPTADVEQLDLRASSGTASILLLHQPDGSSYTYGCSVKHERETVEATVEDGVSKHPPTELPSVTLSTNQTAAERPPLELPPSPNQVRLLCLVYTVLIVKSLVYCCGVSLLRRFRNSCKQAAD